MPSLVVDVNSWTRLACYPRGSFYPVSYGLSTQRRRITKPDFRLWSRCLSPSQAGFCLYTLRRVSIPSEPTFGRLRYSFGGDRPSQTAHLSRSRFQLMQSVRVQTVAGWYFTSGSTEPASPASQPPTYPTQPLPKPNDKLQSSSTGSFCPAAGRRHLHRHCNFTESLVETVPHSLHLSCGSELTRQGISLP